jgi:galactose-6-phosphate isomerase
MANIDVTDLLDDPDFIDNFTVNRFRHIVDDNGRAVRASIGAVTTHGSVQPSGGRTMNLMPDMTTVNGSIEIWTKYRLEVASDTSYADIITWQNRHYEVRTVQPWTNYGKGFVHAICTMLEFLAPAPDNVPGPTFIAVRNPNHTNVITGPGGPEVLVLAAENQAPAGTEFLLNPDGSFLPTAPGGPNVLVRMP